MADYWAKVYIEIIDDPKMATLPDRLWRRIIELFLLAKKFNNGGHLPDTKQLAWMLRMATDDLDLDMKQISSTKIVVQTETGWFIPNFEKRQAAATNTERVQQFRKRQQKEQYYGNVTQTKRNVSQSTETETETETEVNKNNVVVVNQEKQLLQRPNIYSIYESEIGMLTPFIADSLDEIEKHYPDGWFVLAVKEAKSSTTRVSLKYIQKILDRWKKEGLPNKYKPEQPKNGKKTEYQELWKDGQLIFIPVDEVVNES